MKPFRIANAHGISGTAGALVRDASGCLFLLCTHHVLFADAATVNDTVWALPNEADEDGAVAVGRAHSGYLERVSYAGDVCFVDCALIEVDRSVTEPWLVERLMGPWPADWGVPAQGMRVSKHGAATGSTVGWLTDICHSEGRLIGGHARVAPAQLLIESFETGLNFSAPGDSGAAVIDEEGRAVGLLWGSNGAGQSVACRIGAVLSHLDVTLTACAAFEALPRRSV